jgi:hypothetical protein
MEQEPDFAQQVASPTGSQGFELDLAKEPLATLDLLHELFAQLFAVNH